MKTRKYKYIFFIFLVSNYSFAFEPHELTKLNSMATEKHQVFDIIFQLNFKNIENIKPAIKSISNNKWLYGASITAGADGYNLSVKRAIVSNYDDISKINDFLFNVAQNNNGKYESWNMVKEKREIK